MPHNASAKCKPPSRASIRRVVLLQLGLDAAPVTEGPRRGCHCAEEVPARVGAERVRVDRRVQVDRRVDVTHAEVTADFDLSVESVRRCVRQAGIADGVVDRQTSA